MSELEVMVRRLDEQTDAQQAYCCMTEVPTPWHESLCLCRDWVAQNLHRYVEGYHAQDRDGKIIGHFYYAPSESALLPYHIEPGAAVIYCEWTVRQFQGQGVRRRLFDAFVADMRERACKGILIECAEGDSAMVCERYLARGFKVLRESRARKLLDLPLSQPSVEVQPLVPGISLRRGMPVEILILSGFVCPVDVSTQVLLLDVAREFGDRVVLRREALTPETLRRYGSAQGIFINGREKLAGAMTEQAIRQAIAEEM
jgi:GNAT superfamily N-acetyltransferase